MSLLEKSDDECKDIWGDCKKKRRGSNPCQKNKVMRKNCQKYCKACIPEATTPTITTPPTISTSTTAGNITSE